MNISPPKEDWLSEEGRCIWENLSFWEQLYCKYCFLQNTNISTVFVGVFSAYLVNIFTSITGITFLGIFHIIVYTLNATFSVVVFICVVRLYSFHVDSKETIDSQKGTKSDHVTSELEFFKKNRPKTQKILYSLLVFMILLLITLVICSAINNFNSSPVELNCGQNSKEEGAGNYGDTQSILSCLR